MNRPLIKCPIDHIIHNGHDSPGKVFILEYKKNGAPLSDGQARLLKALTGDWQDQSDGRMLVIRHQVLDLLPDNPRDLLEPIVEWLWPPRNGHA